MRVVVDTNVFVSAILKTTSIPALAIRLAQRNGVLLKSNDTEAEIRQVLARPRLAPYVAPSVLEWLDEALGSAELVTITEQVATCRDPKDDKFLELAQAGRADLIVSGDDDLLSMGEFRDIPIVKPAAFVSISR